MRKVILVIVLLVMNLCSVLVYATTSANSCRTMTTGDASNVTFTFTFPLLESSDMIVMLRTTSTGAEVIQVETTHYAVTATNNDFRNGGTVTFVSAPAATEEILLLCGIPETQETDLYDSGILRLEAVELANDKLTRLIQQHSEELTRCLKFPPTDASDLSSSVTDSVTRAGRYLYFDDDGEPLPSQSVVSSTAVVSAYMETVLDDADADAAKVTLEISDETSVKDYGATGDGVTDDTSAINDALTAGAGGTVFFPDGTYLISDDLDVSANTAVNFQSWNAIVKMNSSGTSRRIFNTQGNDNIVFRNGKINGHNDVHTSKAHQGISLLDGSNFCIVEKMWIINCGQYGIVDGDTGVNSGGKGHQILNNIVDMSAALAYANPIGIEVFPKGGAGYLAEPGILIDGNIVLGNAYLIDGIKVNANRGARIVNNWIDNVASVSATGGINIVSSEHCLIANNTIIDSKQGIIVSGSTTGETGLGDENIHIINNILQGITDEGIFSAVGFRGLKILGNTIDSDGAEGEYAIDLLANTTEYTGLTIENNTFFEFGIRLRDDVDTGLIGHPRARIAYNTFIVTDATTADSAIRIEDADYATIIGNLIYEAPAGGINAQGDNISIIGNKILDGNTGNTGNVSAILVTGDYPSILGNRIENVSGGNGFFDYGIRCTSTDRPTIRNNTIDGMDTHSFYLASVTNIVGEQSTAYFGTIAAGTPDERPIFQAPTRCGITKIFVTNATTVTPDDSDYDTYNVEDKGATGTGATEVLAANPTTKDTGGIDINKFNPVSLGDISGTEDIYELAAESALSLTITDTASGQGTDEMRVTVQYLTY